jgi:hypothetical protein
VTQHQRNGAALTDFVVHMAATLLLGINSGRFDAQPLTHQLCDGISAFFHIFFADGGTLMLRKENGIGDHLFSVVQDILAYGFASLHSCTSIFLSV